jgi:hypothetical protein
MGVVHDNMRKTRGMNKASRLFAGKIGRQIPALYMGFCGFPFRTADRPTSAWLVVPVRTATLS